MSSVVNEFSASNVKCSEAERKVYITGLDGFKGVYEYNIRCTHPIYIFQLQFFFNIKTQTMLVLFKETGRYRCAQMSFHINELGYPVSSAQWLGDLNGSIAEINLQFKEQHAAYELDKIINS